MDIVKHLKFPMTFDPVRLKQDLARITDNNWKAHYNKEHYSGNWTSVALFAAGGKSTSIYAVDHSNDHVVPTELMEGCAYFAEVIGSFDFPIITARLLRLDSGAVIKPHTDNCLGYEDGEFRLHIPVITNPDVEFILAGERLVMDEGSCWYINANEEHSVANRGAEDRIHLVIDGKRNAWTDELFFSMAPASGFERAPKPLNSEEQRMMIAELEKIDTPAARAILATMRQE